MTVKICGLSESETLHTAVDAGARYVGFVFFKKSPRHLTLRTAQTLAEQVPPGVCKTALTVNASNVELDRIVDQVSPDMLQLHGDESPDRVLEIKKQYGLPVMKAVGITDQDDVPALQTYARVSDQILVDAKPPKYADLPGGNGLTFDWRLIAGHRWSVPWMLAGGLTAQNVAMAMRLTGAAQIDVSSGVESAPGIKDKAKITEFIRAAKGESNGHRKD